MRVLLINPFYPISETPSPPLGLAYLAAALEAAGVEVRVLDLVVFPYSRRLLETVLQDFAPRVVGLTAVTMTFDHAARVVRDVKSLAPEIVTVMGGPHVTFCAAQTMTACPELDIIVLGEGDDTIVELARALENGSDLQAVRGIVVRREQAVRFTATRDFIADIDRLPMPARHLLPLGRYRALGMPISLTTSRGCPFKCIFCVGRRMVGAKVRYRDPLKVVDELAYLSTLDFHQINIADDLFTANKAHCLTVCDEIVRRGLKLRWTSFARVDTVSRDLLARMQAAGCQAVSFGVETANADILKTIKKGITLPQVIEAVTLCNETGVLPHVSFILGLPGETQASLHETVAFGEQLKQMGVQHGFHLLAPFPGTAVREENDQYDLKILSNDWSQYHANRAICETAAVTRQELDDIVIQWEEDFNKWLGWIEDRMTRGEAEAHEAWQLENLKRIVLIYDLMMKETIETKGYMAGNGENLQPAAALRELAARAAPDVSPHDVDQVYQTLRYAFDKGRLTFDQQEEGRQWQWVDYLP
jgi:radical SAM superfamily enzyme YgiQ (UPF0313 family)